MQTSHLSIILTTFVVIGMHGAIQAEAVPAVDGGAGAGTVVVQELRNLTATEKTLLTGLAPDVQAHPVVKHLLRDFSSWQERAVELSASKKRAAMQLFKPAIMFEKSFVDLFRDLFAAGQSDVDIQKSVTEYVVSAVFDKRCTVGVSSRGEVYLSVDLEVVGAEYYLIAYFHSLSRSLKTPLLVLRQPGVDYANSIIKNEDGVFVAPVNGIRGGLCLDSTLLLSSRLLLSGDEGSGVCVPAGEVSPRVEPIFADGFECGGRRPLPAKYHSALVWGSKRSFLAHVTSDATHLQRLIDAGYDRASINRIVDSMEGIVRTHPWLAIPYWYISSLSCRRQAHPTTVDELSGLLVPVYAPVPGPLEGPLDTLPFKGKPVLFLVFRIKLSSDGESIAKCRLRTVLKPEYLRTHNQPRDVQRNLLGALNTPIEEVLAYRTINPEDPNPFATLHDASIHESECIRDAKVVKACAEFGRMTPLGAAVAMMPAPDVRYARAISG